MRECVRAFVLGCVCVFFCMRACVCLPLPCVACVLLHLVFVVADRVPLCRLPFVFAGSDFKVLGPGEEGSRFHDFTYTPGFH